MTVESTYLKDCYVITPQIYSDSRGNFFESFNRRQFLEATGLDLNFVQDNQSRSSKGVGIFVKGRKRIRFRRLYVGTGLCRWETRPCQGCHRGGALAIPVFGQQLRPTIHDHGRQVHGTAKARGSDAATMKATSFTQISSNNQNR